MNKFFMVIILFFGTGLLFGCSADETNAKQLANAQEYFDAGEMKAASIELKNILQNNPGNPSARLLMGKVHFEIGNMPAAEKELTRARELGVEDELILPLLSRVLYLQGKRDELQSLTLQNLTMQAQAEVLAVQGEAKLAQGETAEAALMIEQALAKDPESINVLIATARIHAANQEFDLAREKLETAFLINRKSASTWSILGDIEWQEKKYALAEEAYSKAIEYRTNNFAERYKRAMARLQLKKYKKAQQDIDVMMARFPQHAGANFIQGQLYFNDKNFKDAARSLEVAVSSGANIPLALYYLGTSYFLLNNLEQAETYARRYLSIDPESINGRKLLAMIKDKKQEYSEIEELIRPVIEARKDDIAAVNLLASALIKEGRVSEAIDLLSQAAAMEPDSPEAQFRLGAGLLAAGQQDSGVKHLEKAIQLQPDYMQAIVMLALHYSQKDHDEAIKVAKKYREQNPDIAAPYNLLGKIYLAANQEKAAQDAFFKAREIAPGDPLACKALATLSLKDKDLEKARSYYREILKYHENELDSLIGLAKIDGLSNDRQSMVENLQKAIEAHPQAVMPRLILARYYLANGKPERASLLVNELDEQKKSSAAILEVIANTHLLKSEYQQAQEILEKLIAQQPGSAKLHLMLAKTYSGLNNREKTKLELKRSIELSPDFLATRLLLARLLLQEGNKASVLEQLKVLRKLAPDNPAVLHIEASMARLDNDLNEAVRLTEKAFEKQPTTSNMLILARQKRIAGDLEGAQYLQEGWIKEHQDDIDARLALAGFYAANEKVDMAIMQYSRVLETDGSNLLALNNLSWFLRDTNPQLALDYANRAIEIKPDSAALMDTQAVVLLKNGETEKAQRIIARALAKAPGDLTLRYHSAMIDASAGDKASALNTLKSILEEGRNFPDKEEAIKLLRQLES